MKLEDMVERVLVFAAHPDDEIIGCGGTIARLSRAGKEVYVVSFTLGGTAAQSEEEKEVMIEKRRGESEKADVVLGVTYREILGIPSQGVANTTEIYQKVIELIRKYKPDLILTHSYDVKHRDHKAVHEITEETPYKALEPIQQHLGLQWYTKEVWEYEVMTSFDVYDYVVDITDFIDIKKRAMGTQVTQKEVLEGIENYIEGLGLVRGYFSDGLYGEAFRKINTYPTKL